MSRDLLVEASTDPERRITLLFGLLGNMFGPDKLVLRARRLGVVKLVRSSKLGERLLALERLVFEDVSIDKTPSREEYAAVFARIEDELANMVAQRTLELDLQKKIEDKMRERHLEYINDLRRDALKEDHGPETATTMRRLAELQSLSDKGLAESALSVVRPSSLEEVVGQERAIKALRAKLGSPYPQHVILYGPPGVGKTTVARFVLESIKQRGHDSFSDDAPFVEVDATTLRWDAREITNPLLGSVHDPIYQGSRRDLAEDGVPEPKLGLVTKAHGGVLFLDEIGELDSILLNKLLKVLEDKRVIYESSYYNEDDPRVPMYIKELFAFGAPADFILIGATTRQPQDIPLAIRSRCSEVFFEPLTAQNIVTIVEQAAKRINVKLEPGVAEEISLYSIEGRRAVRILTDAYGLAVDAGEHDYISLECLHACLRLNRQTKAIHVTTGGPAEVGRVFGLGVSDFVGSCIEIEACAFPSKKEAGGTVRFNDAAGDMARDSVFNASCVLRQLIDKELSDYDVHVNVVGGGKIDGPSAGLAITLALYSALTGQAISSEVAVTGEVSIRGSIKPVGGIPEKLYGACQAHAKRVLIPAGNKTEIPPDLPIEMEVIPIATVQEALSYLTID